MRDLTFIQFIREREGGIAQSSSDERMRFCEAAARLTSSSTDAYRALEVTRSGLTRGLAAYESECGESDADTLILAVDWAERVVDFRKDFITPLSDRASRILGEYGTKGGHDANSPAFSFSTQNNRMRFMRGAATETKDLTDGNYMALLDETNDLRARIDALSDSRRQLDKNTIKHAVHWHLRVGPADWYNTSKPSSGIGTY